MLDLYKKTTENRFVIIFSLPFLYFGFLLVQEPPLNYDTNMYHFQAILWNDVYPAVPGLANIRGQLGFNNSILVLHSLFSLKRFFGQHLFVLNYFIYCIGAIYFIKRIYETCKTQKGSTWILWANAFLLIGFVSRVYEISSPTPDFGANAILMVLLAYCINNHDEKLQWIPVCLIAVYIVTIKLSMLPILILFGFGVFQLFKNREIKAIRNVVLFSAILMSIWCTRNVILTGWLVYPVHLVDLFDYDWKVSMARIMSENDTIKGWARYPDFAVDIKTSANMRFREWFPYWWGRATLGRYYLLSAIVSTVIFIIWIFKGKANYSNTLFWTGICTVSAFIFWFVMAPDFRFCIGYIFMLMALPLFLFSNLKLKLMQNINAHKYPVVAVLFVFLSYSAITKWEIVNNNVFPSFISGRWKLPKTLDYVGRQPMDSFFERDYVFYYPKYSLQNNDTRCYDQCIPCLPFRDTALVLRGKTLSSGFRRNDNLE